MLGVFGCVPAFDRYFEVGLGVSTLGPKSLHAVRSFYEEHAEAIQGLGVPTIDSATGAPAERRTYAAAKVFDMVFFIEGLRKLGPAPVSD